jgi:ABC-type uncharacterized transport system permease subunit
MPVLWLRIALGCYAVGLVYALVAFTRASELVGKVVLHAAYLGMVFHFVSLMESVVLSGHIAQASARNPESLLAFLMMLVFMVVYMVYKTTSPGVIVFPVVFLLTFVSATGQQPFLIMASEYKKGWLAAHIGLILTGYAALIVSFASSLLYLVQERSLKSKRPGSILARLPALEVIDDIGYRSLLLGFPFMTLGLVAGTVVAQEAYGRVNFLDPKIFLSLLMWAVYLVMVFTRWNSGWRGRRAAYLATFAFVAAVVAWAANYFSAIHRFVQS